ncbi:hypothetical protein [Fluviicola taffensis]|uniref:hypothetical protein n=1 Tax=Fluviicola taffensis TaxID=191579 RepID=UPI00313815DF
MRIIYSIIILLAFCSCQENDDLVISVKNVSFKAASTENEYAVPMVSTDSISSSHFLFEVNWDIQRTDVGYDPVETTVINSNPVDSIKIWSDQIVAGRNPGNSLNTLFYQQIYSLSVSEPDLLEENGSLIYNSSFDTFEEPLRKVSYLIPNFQINPGTYNFYFRCILRNGTILSSSLPNVIIKQ